MFAQTNIDSLFVEIKESCIFVKPLKTKWQFDSFTLYRTKDSSELYYVSQDENGNLTSKIGLCILFQKFDKTNRLSKTIGYSNKGEYYYWDYSPITEEVYNGDTTIEKFYNSDYKLTDILTKINDENGKLKEEISQSFKTSYFLKTTYNYSDKSGEVLISKFDSTNKLIIDNNGVAHIIVKKTNPTEIVEITQTYIDSNFNQVEAMHNVNNNSIKFKFSKFIKVTYFSSGTSYEFYNKKNELVYNTTFIGE